jgi:AcrR family transcriptional regulator
MTPDQYNDGSAAPTGSPGGRPAGSIKDRIIEALMELAAEREWDDFGLTDVAARAGVSLSEFRDAFPSKGAVLAGFARKIDHVVLQQAGETLADEAPRERVFDVLMRRLDALAPYKLGLQGIMESVRREPLSGAALNGVAANSMRFMLAAAGIDINGNMAPIKLQGLVLAWGRVLDVWFEDDDAGQARTMAALDRELSRGETWVTRLDDLDRLLSPLRIMGRAMMDARRRSRDRKPKMRAAMPDDLDAGTPIG